MLQHVDFGCLQQCPVSYSTGAAGNDHLRRQEFWWSIIFYSENVTIKKKRKKNNMQQFIFSVLCVLLENFQEKVASSGEIKQKSPIAQMFLSRDSVPDHPHWNCPQGQGLGLWWVDLSQQPNTCWVSSLPCDGKKTGGRHPDKGTSVGKAKTAHSSKGKRGICSLYPFSNWCFSTSWKAGLQHMQRLVEETHAIPPMSPLSPPSLQLLLQNMLL